MMKALPLILAGLLVSTDAFAQGDRASPPPGEMSPRAMAACEADLVRLCADRSLKQECLVRHWTEISGGCQDALAKPMRPGG